MSLTEFDSHASARIPIGDVTAWFDGLPEDTRRALVALGELLIGTVDRPAKSETAEAFTIRGLGVDSFAGVLDEDRSLNHVQRLTVALALAELIDLHGAEVGPGEDTNPPAYTQTEVGEAVYRHPLCLRAIFPAGTVLASAPVVIGIDGRAGTFHDPEATAFVMRDHQTEAREVLDRLMARADELNPYRGRVVRASFDHGLKFTAITLPQTLTRDTVVVDENVWQEVDLGVRAVRDQHAMLNAHGLGCRRGVLMVGPPGTGKSAVSAVVARELVGTFSVIYVEAKAGEHLLTAVVEQAQRFGGPVLLILEDVDLFVRDRRRGDGGGLSELLQAMDIAANARILTLASTNDAQTLDAAAIRTGRFDSIVELGYPDKAAAARILAALVDGIPGEVDTSAVAARLPERTSGSDLREIVRRAVLSSGGTVSTAALLSEIGTGRYRAQLPGTGQYL